jgi:azurin
LWTEASATPLTFQSLMGALHLIPNAELRATAYDRVLPLLAKPITEFEGPDHIIAATQRDTIRAAVSTRREPAAVFAALNTMIERGYQVPTAAQGIRNLSRTAWTPNLTAPAAQALIAWAGQTHTNERTSRDYVETIQVADELAGLQPPGEAAALRQALSKLRVSVYIVRAVVEQMRFDTPRLVVPAGRSFEIIFENPDVMPHNLVVVEPGARERVGTEAMQLPAENLDRQGRAWVGESREIVAATKLLETGQSETLRLRPIREEGVYEYVCTFPGHWTVMYGQLVVTKDVDAYLKANPAAAPAKPAATASAHGHGSH